MRTALCARSRLHFLTLPVFHRRVVVVHVLDVRLGDDARSVADSILLETVVGQVLPVMLVLFSLHVAAR